MNLNEKILKKIKELEFDAFTISDIIDLGAYNNLRKTLERMVKSNQICRVLRGVYYIPEYIDILDMYSVPSVEGIAKAIARNLNWDIYPSGNYALNILGLSTQVPCKYIYTSSGPYKTYEYGGIIIEFKHASLKETNSFSYNTNLVIQALKILGKENVTINHLKKIKTKFSTEQIYEICNEAKSTTIWIYEKILKMKEL